MLVYGGLLASREPRDPEVTCRARLDSLGKVLAARGSRPVLASTVIRRFASTVLTRADMAEWEARHRDPDLAARARNHAVNRKALELVAEGGIDFLSLLQEDCAESRDLSREHEALRARIGELGIEAATVLTPGADEGGRVLLARAFGMGAKRRPRVALHFASSAASTRVARYENVPLVESARGQVHASGAELVAEGPRDLDLFVWAPDRPPGDRWLDPAPEAEEMGPAPGHEPSYEARLRAALRAGGRVALADVADANGADPYCFQAMHSSVGFAGLCGYSAWNTAGNSLGCALAQGLLPGDPRPFLQLRLLEDAAYQAWVRPVARRWVTEEVLADEWCLEPSALARAETFVAIRLRRFWEEHQPGGFPALPEGDLVRLPWARLFELELALPGR
jgi:hypothetical protein